MLKYDPFIGGNMIDELQDKFGLNAIEVESEVYRVNNTEPVNVDELKGFLKKCILITSGDRNYIKDKAGRNRVITRLYYIILDYDNAMLRKKYRSITKEELDKNCTIDSYWERPHLATSIDTIYTAEELGRK